jgi:hypothetical protein
MRKRSAEELDRNIKRARFVLLISVIGIIWLVSFYVIRVGFANMPKIRSEDLSAIISGTGTIALSVFSILVAVAAIYGINSLDRKIHDVVKVVTNEKISRTEKELRGRSFAMLGYLIGENSVENNLSSVIDDERLREAIYYSEYGYQFLKDTNLPAEYMALNNFLGYSCALSGPPGSPLPGRKLQNPRLLLNEAARLREAAEEHGATNLLLTYARTILFFSKNDEEIAYAYEIVREADENPSRLSARERADAASLRKLFEERSPK